MPWLLRMNRMTDPKVELMTNVALAESKEALKSYVEKEKVEPYTDGEWHKIFRKDGPLEWFNAPMFDEESFIKVMSLDEVISKTVEDYNDHFSGVPRI